MKDPGLKPPCFFFPRYLGNLIILKKFKKTNLPPNNLKIILIMVKRLSCLQILAHCFLGLGANLSYHYFNK